jgi:hypothetical protein
MITAKPRWRVTALRATGQVVSVGVVSAATADDAIARMRRDNPYRHEDGCWQGVQESDQVTAEKV